MKKWLRWIALLMVPLLATGCWDRTELNDLAFDMGLAIDFVKAGSYEANAQIAIPSQLAGNPSGITGSSGGKSYFIVTGTGKNTQDAMQEMQQKLSRRINEGHRRVIFIGEEMARKGIRSVVDLTARDPEARIRTDMFVVRGVPAKDVLDAYYPFERVPVLGAIKLHKVLGATEDASYRDFLIKDLDSSSSPTLPVIETYQEPDGEKQGFRFGGRAIFNKRMELIGYIDAPAAFYRAWITGQTNRQTLTMPHGHGDGKISLRLTRLRRRIRPVLTTDGKIIMHVTLMGRGEILENGTMIDLTEGDSLIHVEDEFERYSAAEALRVIKEVQQDYSADIFGFGAAVHRAYPAQWRTIQPNWSPKFAKIEVHVQSKLRIERIGLTAKLIEMS